MDTAQTRAFTNSSPCIAEIQKRLQLLFNTPVTSLPPRTVVLR